MNLADIFILGPLPADMIVGVYDLKLVALSYIVASCASYIALDVTGRLRDAGNTKVGSLLWLLGGSFALGAGIWSMHFIGMLAFVVPGMNMQYSAVLTSISMLVAVIASAFALYLLKAAVIRPVRMAIGGVVLGLAIASMHYIGMEAMKVDMNVQYIPSLFLFSLVIAIVASEAALWLALKSNQVIVRFRFRLKLVSALIMGAAICGMHYVGMFAAVFTPLANHSHEIPSLSQDMLAVSIAGVTALILGIAFLASAYKEAQNQQALSEARQTGMAEMATSVLHNVGNVLNSVAISSDRLDEKFKTSELDNLEKLKTLLNENKSNLALFLSEDKVGRQIPEYLGELATYWAAEKKEVLGEVANLKKHIDHISSIIAMQQQLSKKIDFDQVVSLTELLDEAILFSSIEDKPLNINVIKHYRSVQPVKLDKVKLLQIIVNIVKNAKEAMLQTDVEKKELVIEIVKIGESRVKLSFADNGVGISSKALSDIFAYGYTTKQQGHGFGLHASAIAINEMGGEISVDSPGLGKGATFIIELPVGAQVSVVHDESHQSKELVD